MFMVTVKNFQCPQGGPLPALFSSHGSSFLDVKLRRGCYEYENFFFFLGPHMWHMDFPRLGVKSELHSHSNIGSKLHL